MILEIFLNKKEIAKNQQDLAIFIVTITKNINNVMVIEITIYQFINVFIKLNHTYEKSLLIYKNVTHGKSN